VRLGGRRPGNDWHRSGRQLIGWFGWFGWFVADGLERLADGQWSEVDRR